GERTARQAKDDGQTQGASAERKEATGKLGLQQGGTPKRNNAAVQLEDDQWGGWRTLEEPKSWKILEPGRRMQEDPALARRMKVRSPYEGQGFSVEIKVDKDRPNEPVVAVSLGQGSVEKINLNFTPVGDAALKQLEGLAQIRMLWLNHTKITDEGLIHLQAMK